MPIWGKPGGLTWRQIVPPLAVVLALACVAYTLYRCGRQPRLGERQQLKHHLRQLSHSDPGMVAVAAKVLGGLGFPEAIGPLRKRLDSDDPRVRGAVCAALGKLGAQASAEAILKNLDHEDWTVVEGAAEGLGALRHKPAVEPLTRLLDASRPSVRLAVIQALGQIGDPAALPALGKRQQAPTAGLEGDPPEDLLERIRTALDEAIQSLNQPK